MTQSTLRKRDFISLLLECSSIIDFSKPERELIQQLGTPEQKERYARMQLERLLK